MVWLPGDADQDRLRDAVMLQVQQLVAEAAGSRENLQQGEDDRRNDPQGVLRRGRLELDGELGSGAGTKQGGRPDQRRIIPAAALRGPLVPPGARRRACRQAGGPRGLEPDTLEPAL